MHITKSNGTIAQFDPQKIISSLRRAGADDQLARTVSAQVSKKIHEGSSTADIFNHVIEELRDRNMAIASTYDLRNALTKLGPTGFKFEQYLAAILNAYGWTATLPESDLKGLCVDHEVDVVATKNNETVFIEAKFRNTYGDVVTLKDVMATWSAFQDVVEASQAGIGQRFDKLWIMTNGKFTDRAEQFGVCRGIHMFSWNSKSHSLAKMIDDAKLYPVTILDSVKKSDLEQFSKAGIMLCDEITPEHVTAVSLRTGIDPTHLERTANICAQITGGKRAMHSE